MREAELFDYLLEKLAQKIRPIVYEAVNEAILKIQSLEKKPDDDELWSIKDVIKYLTVSKPTVAKWQRLGLIKSYRIGHKVYYKKQEVIKSLKPRKFQ